jgi:hypothetical protein
MEEFTADPFIIFLSGVDTAKAFLPRIRTLQPHFILLRLKKFAWPRSTPVWKGRCWRDLVLARFLVFSSSMAGQCMSLKAIEMRSV